MKKILTLFIALILVAGIVSVVKSVDIDTSCYTSQGVTGRARDRHIVQSSDGTIVVLYQRGSLGPTTFGISAKKSTDNGATWTDLAGEADAFTQVDDTPYSEFSICIDTNDNIYVTYNDYNEPAGNWWVYFKKLTYSAGTWTVGSEKIVSGSSDESSEQSSIIRESDGRIWVAYGYNDEDEGWLMATYSDDEFQTGTDTNVSLSDPDYYALNFHPALVIRNDYPFIVYHNSEEGNSLWWSSWNGSSWSSSQQVSTIDCDGNDFSVTMIGSDVHVVASVGFSMEHTYYNGTWQTTETLASSEGGSLSLTTNNVDLWCFAAIYYPDIISPKSKYNIKYKRRNGSTWDSTWTAITTDNTWNYSPTTPSIVTGDIPFAWTFGAASPYTVKFDILTGPPAPPNVDDGVSGWSSDNTPTFNWDAPSDPSGIEGYWWAIDNPTPETGGTWTTARTATTAPLSDGTHTFYVKARNGNGLLGAAGSHVCYIDRAPPTGTILINNGDTYTNSTSVTLNLSASDSDSGVSKMRFSNDGGSWSPEEDYAATKSWPLTAGDGTKTVYVQYKDNAGNWSAFISDTIILDTTPPAAITDLTGLCDSETGDVTLYWSTPGDDGWTGTLLSGSKYRIDYSTYSITWSTTNYKVDIPTSGVAPHTQVSYTITGLTGDTTRYFQIWTADKIPLWSGLSNGATIWVNPILSVSAEPSEYHFGTMETNVSSVSVTVITVTNTGNVTEIYSINCSSTTKWTPGETPGENQFTLQSAFHPSQPENNDSIWKDDDILTESLEPCTTAAFSIDGTEHGKNVPPFDDNNRNYWFRLKTPLSTGTTYQQTITVTITVGSP